MKRNEATLLTFQARSPVVLSAGRREEGKSITRRHTKIHRQRLEKHILSDPFANKRLSEITRTDVLVLRSRLLVKCSPATVNKLIGIVKVIFREALYREEINRDPTGGIGKIVVDWESGSVEVQVR